MSDMTLFRRKTDWTLTAAAVSTSTQSYLGGPLKADSLAVGGRSRTMVCLVPRRDDLLRSGVYGEPPVPLLRLLRELRLLRTLRSGVIGGAPDAAAVGLSPPQDDDVGGTSSSRTSDGWNWCALYAVMTGVPSLATDLAAIAASCSAMSTSPLRDSFLPDVSFFLLFLSMPKRLFFFFVVVAVSVIGPASVIPFLSVGLDLAGSLRIDFDSVKA
mmetsp:Transcript_11883/g.33968  ORF Transcript_11883/g.33968 Transcript_11883/m.33968 type:complete len:214 (+) Transcript_11883:716-1357(+)